MKKNCKKLKQKAGNSMGWKDRIKPIDEAPKSSWRDRVSPISEESNSSSIVPEIASTGIGSAVGYGTGSLVTKGLNKVGEAADNLLPKIASYASDYTQEQLHDLKQNYSTVKDIKDLDTLSRIQTPFQNLNKDINVLGDQAADLLRGNELSPTEYRQLLTQSLQSPNPATGQTLARPLADETLTQIQQSVDLKGQEETKNQIKNQLESFNQDKLEYNTLRAEANKDFINKKVDELVELQKRANSGIMTPEAEDIIRQNLTKQISQDPKSFGVDFPEFQNKEFVPNLKKEQLQKTLEDYRKGLVSQKSVKISQEFPELIGKNLAPAVERDIKNAFALVPPNSNVTGEDLVNVTRSLREKGFSPEGEVTSEFPAVAQGTVREKIDNLSPEAGKLISQQGDKLTSLENLEEAGYLTRGRLGDKAKEGFIQVGPKQIDKIASDIVNKDEVVKNKAISYLNEVKALVSPQEYKMIELGLLKRVQGTDAITSIPTSKSSFIPSLKSNKLAAAVATLPEMISHNLPKTTKVAKGIIKYAPKAAGVLAGGAIGFAAQAAEEAIDSETSGATMESPAAQEDYLFESGTRDPKAIEEAKRLYNFKQGLPNQGRMDEVPSAYDKPETKQYKENVLKAKERGQLKDDYVTPLADKASDLKKLQQLQEQFRSMSGKGAEAMANTIDKSINGTDEERIKSDFVLKQNQAIRNKLY